MKAKEVAKLLLQNPDMDVEVGVYTYQSCEDSVGAHEFTDVEVISIHKGKHRKPTIVLTGERIGYPDNPEDFEVIS